MCTTCTRRDVVVVAFQHEAIAAHPVALRDGAVAGRLVVMGLLWVRSYWRMDVAGFVCRETAPAGATYRGVSSHRGRVYGERVRLYDQPKRPLVAGWRFGSLDLNFYAGSPVIEPSVRRSWYGFSTRHGPADDAWFSMPWAYPCAIAALLPAMRSAAWYRRRRRRPAGSCRSCGYDLRATPDRCPECGTATSVAGGHA